MKTKEFKQAIEALGFTVVKEDSDLVVNGEGSLWLADVSLKYKYALRPYFGAIDEVGEEKTRKLAELLFEYASTPLDEREEPKKWRIKCPITGQFLNRSKWEDDSFSWRGNSFETPEYQPQFTRQDIEEYEFPMENLIEEEVPNNER
ncbi:hypothetical protein [Listeria booriae]|uniref:hypothetical protein n=1 Tax=Listeria booriae TaxID=1552123 RepID=UPI00163D6DF6|nr:hypothetical protein [Listeria booriae]MBC1306835.1 hypothetical protein [Listeria booriae]